MTKIEFATRQQEFNKEALRFSWLFILFCVALVVLAFGILYHFEDEHKHVPNGVALVTFSSTFVLLLFCKRFAFRRFSELKQKHEVLCPSCGKDLTGPTGKLAVATGTCAHCGRDILEANT